MKVKIREVKDLINYLYEDKPEEVIKFLINQIAKSTDYNKGYLWENVLAKAMPHTKLLGGNTKGMDFTDGSDAKIGTYYRKSDGKKEVSVGIKNKTGTLRVCLVDPGQDFHRVFFLLIPEHAYKSYSEGSQAVKFGLNPRGSPTGKLAKFMCSWDQVIAELPKTASNQ